MSTLPGKMRALATNVPAEVQWLFGDDLNKKIAQISSMNNALSQSFRSSNQQGRCNHSSASTYHEQHQRSNKPTLPEELRSSEEGSEAEQQPILQELNVVSTNTSCTFVAGK